MTPWTESGTAMSVITSVGCQRHRAVRSPLARSACGASPRRRTGCLRRSRARAAERELGAPRPSSSGTSSSASSASSGLIVRAVAFCLAAPQPRPGLEQLRPRRADDQDGVSASASATCSSTSSIGSTPSGCPRRPGSSAGYARARRGIAAMPRAAAASPPVRPCSCRAARGRSSTRTPRRPVPRAPGRPLDRLL